MILSKTLDKILIFTNPLIYAWLIVIGIYLPFYYLWRWLRLHDLWYIYFKLEKLNRVELDRFEQICNRNINAANSTKWSRYIHGLALRRANKYCA